MDNKILLVFGLLLFYLIFGLLYLSFGNTLSEYNNDDLPVLTEKDYTNNVVNEDTQGLFKFIVNGVQGYDESENLVWINYIFVFLTALLIFSIIIVVLHG